MRSLRCGKKNLIAALHWVRAEPPGWSCAECRRAGLEPRRRCGFSEAARATPERVVWASGSVALTECPKSYIKPESIMWIEKYFAGARRAKSARETEAFLILKTELANERQ